MIKGINREKRLVEVYGALNASFRKTCVFHVGASGGFFSEYNMMLLAMLYCLVHRIRFTLYSADANFAYGKGWTDYFEPFCEECSSSVHRRLNQRPTGDWKTIWRLAAERRSAGVVAWKLKSEAARLMAEVEKRRAGVDYYMRDIWPGLLAMRTDERYRIPELGIDGDLSVAVRTLARMTWRLNPETAAEVNALRMAAGLPERYVGCQIRGGDKTMEFGLVPAEEYVRTLAARSAVKDVFVLTDDYRSLEELRRNHPDRRWFSLCEETERGYVHGAFVRNSKEELRRRIVRLLASVDTLTGAELFAGTRTSNPSVFLYMYMPESCVDTDGNENLLTNSTLGIK